VRSLRRAVSDTLLEWGARTALDAQEMLRKARQSGVRRLSPADLQLLGALDLWSTAAIRLGTIIMPSRLPGFPSGSTEVPS
jgi:hypothetical protein